MEFSITTQYLTVTVEATTGDRKVTISTSPGVYHEAVPLLTIKHWIMDKEIPQVGCEINVSPIELSVQSYVSFTHLNQIFPLTNRLFHIGDLATDKSVFNDQGNKKWAAAVRQVIESEASAGKLRLCELCLPLEDANVPGTTVIGNIWISQEDIRFGNVFNYGTKTYEMERYFKPTEERSDGVFRSANVRPFAIKAQKKAAKSDHCLELSAV